MQDHQLLRKFASIKKKEPLLKYVRTVRFCDQMYATKK